MDYSPRDDPPESAQRFVALAALDFCDADDPRALFYQLHDVLDALGFTESPGPPGGGRGPKPTLRCKNGHFRSKNNTKLNANGHVECLACRRVMHDRLHPVKPCKRCGRPKDRTAGVSYCPDCRALRAKGMA